MVTVSVAYAAGTYQAALGQIRFRWRCAADRNDLTAGDETDRKIMRDRIAEWNIT